MKGKPLKKAKPVRPCDKCYKPLEDDEVGRCKKHVAIYGQPPIPKPNGKKPGRKPLPPEQRKKPNWNWRKKAANMPGKPLTEVEVEILELLAAGYNSTNTHIKPTTFNSRLLKVRTKLKAKSSPHAVAIAFRQGLIE